MRRLISCFGRKLQENCSEMELVGQQNGRQLYKAALVKVVTSFKITIYCITLEAKIKSLQNYKYNGKTNSCDS